MLQLVSSRVDCNQLWIAVGVVCPQLLGLSMGIDADAPGWDMNRIDISSLATRQAES